MNFTKTTARIGAVALATIGFLSSVAPAAFAVPQKAVREQLTKLFSAGKSEASVSVVDVTTREVVAAWHAELALRPASVLKLVTSLAALQDLGPDYRFRTEVWSTPATGGSASAVYLRGGADPNLTIEELWLILRELRRRGITRIGLLGLDATRQQDALARSGQRAYETAAAPLAFNFNSVAFEVCPTAVGQAARVAVDPFEAGIVITGGVTTTKAPGTYGIDELNGERDTELPRYRLSGTIGVAQECEVHYRSVPDPLAYLAAVIRPMAAQIGITIERTAAGSSSASGAHLLFVHESKPLREVLSDLNHFSNNFIAEQILAVLGAGENGNLVRAQGLERLKALVNRLGIAAGEAEVVDGSGLSRSNRLSARALTTILRAAAADPTVAAEYAASLSVGGRSGTLKHRSASSGGTILRGKTGTLDGVSSLAGYLYTADGRTLAVAIIQNGIAKDEAVRREDAAIELLKNAR